MHGSMLTSFQKDVYFEQNLNPDSTLYSLLSSFNLPAGIDERELVRAIQQTTLSIEMLNCNVHSSDTEDALYFGHRYYSPESRYKKYELSSISELVKLENKYKNWHYDLHKSPLFHAILVTVKQDKYLLLAGHHLIADGHSFAQIIRSICYCYDNIDLPISSSVAELVEYQNKLLKPELVEKSLAFWRQKKLSQYDCVFEASNNSTYEVDLVSLSYNLDKWKKFNAVAKKNKLSLYHLMLSCFSLVVKRMCGSDKFLLGNVTHNRGNAAVKKYIGMMSSIFPVMFDLKGVVDIFQLSRATAAQLKQSYRYQKLPLSLLLAKSTNNKPFDILFNYQKLDGNLTISGQSFSSRIVSQDNTSVPLVVDIIDLGGENEVELRVRFDSTLITKTLAQNLLRLLAITFDRLNQGHVNYNSLTYLPQNMQSISQPSLTVVDTAPHVDNVWSLLNISFQSDMNKTAIIDNGQYYSYQALYQLVSSATDNLADLFPAQSLIGVHYPRGIKQIVAMLACFKANMIFVPMDLGQDNKRLVAIDKSLCLASILSDTWSLSATAQFSYEALTSTRSQNQSLPNYNAKPSDSAFIIFTSGTTNKPKAVEMTHSGLVALILGQKEHCSLLNKPSCCLQFTSINFDVAIQEVLTAFHGGGTLVCTSEQQRTDLDMLVSIIKSTNVETAFFPNTVLQQVLGYCVEQNISLTSLSLIVTAGEALVINKTLKLFFSHHTTCRLLNHYGPTETHVATGYLLPKNIESWPENPPIGTPLPHAQVAIINKLGEVTAKGGIGELYIFGDGLAKGYFAAPQLTKRSFIENCLNEGIRGYATGDLCKYGKNGNIEFLARNKNQIKVNGIRIDVDEIIREVRHLMGDVNLVVLQITRTNQLVIALEGIKLHTDDVLNQLSSILPNYMCPSAIRTFDKFPTTQNGKLDAKALIYAFNELDEPSMFAEENIELPDVYHRLQDCWQQIFSLDVIGPNDNFFLLGGHSMTATRLVKSITDSICNKIKLTDVFNQPTLIEQYQLIVKLLSQKDTRPEKLLANAQQEALYRYQLTNPESCQYNMSCVYRLENDISVSALQQVFELVISKHKLLCSTFVEQDFILNIVSSNEMNFWLYSQVLDLNLAIERFFNTPFKLDAEQPLRVHVYETEEQRVLAVSFHHIAMDAESLSLFKKEIDNVYQEIILGKITSKKLQTEDYNNLQYQTTDSHLTYWSKRLSDMSGNLSLPIEYRHFQAKAAKYREYQTSTILLNLESLAKQHECSTALAFEISVALLSSYLCQQSLINIGVPFSLGTQQHDVTSVGYFVNTLPIVYRIESSLSVSDLFYMSKSNRIADFAYADVDISAVNLAQSSSGLFQIFVQWLNEDPTDFALGDNKLNVIREMDVCRFDISLSFIENSQNSFIQVDYDEGKYSELYISNFVERIKLLTAQLACGSKNGNTINELNFLLPREHQQIFSQQVIPSSYSHITNQFNNIANQYANRNAIAFEGKYYDYAWLLSQVNRVSAALQELTLPLGSHVVVALPREPVAIVCQLALWQCGLVYVPLQSQFPKQRLLSILDEVKPVLVIHSGDWHYGYPELLVTERIVARMPLKSKIETRRCEVAYILFTSGSTGKPKGVEVKHVGLSSLLSGLINTFNGNENDIMPSFGDLTFGVAFVECLLPLMVGGQCVIVSRDVQKNVEALLPLLKDCTLVHLIPSLARVIAQHPLAHNLKSARYIFVGGDALNCALVNELQKLFSWAKVVEFYGQTEGTILTTYCPFEQMIDQQPNDNILGGTLPHAKVWILNKNYLPVPFGVAGDMYISGDGVAKGYINDELKTQECFVFLPKLDQGVFLKTGDRAKYTQTGLLQYLGRKDFQINMNGYRIEPAEIEHVLKVVSGSQICVAKWFEEQQTLVGYYLNNGVSKRDILKGVKAYLPDYMLPHRLVGVDEFPLNRNNKVDRNALEMPSFLELESCLEAENEQQAGLFSLWQDVFGQPVMSWQDDFFQTGSHSLKATEFVTKFNVNFTVELTLRRFFELASINNLYSLLIDQQDKPTPIKQIERINALVGAMSRSQKRMYWLHQLDTLNPAYDKNLHLKFTSLLDADCLQNALHQLIERHTVLRTIYPNGETQKVLSTALCSNNFELLSIGSDVELMMAKTKLANMRFDLTTQTQFKVIMLQDTVAQQTNLLFKTHHIATDGVSMQLLSNDLLSLYELNTCPELKVTYIDFSEWEAQQVLPQLVTDFWQNYLEKACFVNALPLDFPRSNEQQTSQDNYLQVLKRSRIRAVSSRLKITEFELLLAIYAYVVNRFSNSTDVLITVPEHGRMKPELHNIVGCFINSVVTRHQSTKNQTLNSYLLASAQNTRSALAHSEMGMEQLVEIIEPDRNSSAAPISQLLFNYQSELTTEMVFSNNKVVIEEFGEEHSLFEISLHLIENNDEIKIQWQYGNQLFNADTIMKLSDNYAFILDDIENLLEQNCDLIKLTYSNLPDSAIDTCHGLTDIEQMILDVLTECGTEENIDPNQHFFELDGDSRLAEKIISKVNAKFSINLSIQALFDAQSIERLSQLVVALLLEPDAIENEYEEEGFL